MIIMSVDLGKARTGIAVCDNDEILASPVGVIAEKSEELLSEKIAKQAKTLHAQIIILGLPKNMDGTLGESAQRAKKFAKMLESKTEATINLWDERRTTITAHEYLSEVNVRGKKRKSIIDAVSATIILENYLNFRKKQG